MDDNPQGTPTRPASIDATEALLAAHDYVADRSLATAVFLALALQRPLLLEGEPGTGKTEIAKVLAAGLGAELIRLQCYEGLDIAGAAYEWNYAAQMLEIRLAEASPEARTQLAQGLFSGRFLIERPLLRALLPHAVPPVLLIDELDRTDEPFEAYLLEVLAEWQITIPEWRTVRALQPPVVVITSNRTREIHDAVRRRCIYHWVDYPTAARELAIVRRRLPQVHDLLSRQVVAFVQALRKLDLLKQPGVAETLEWARALQALDAAALDAARVDHTLGVLLKTQEDIARVQGAEAAKLLAHAHAAAAGICEAAPAAGAD
jgi:MoxR-like ATPase